MSLPVRLRLALDAVIIVFFAITAYVSLEWQLSARIMPLAVSGAAVVLGIGNLIFDVRRWQKVGYAFVAADRGKKADDVAESRDEASREEATAIKVGLRYFGWITAFCVVVWVAGSMIGAALYLLVFLRYEGHYTWRFTFVSIAGVLIGIWALERLLELRLPESLLGF